MVDAKLFGWRFNEQTVTVRVAAGQVASAGMKWIGPAYRLSADAQPRSSDDLSRYDLARALHDGERIEAIRSRLGASKTGAQAAVGGATSSAQRAFEAAMPTSQQVASTLEVIAGIAFVAMLLVAGAYSPDLAHAGAAQFASPRPTVEAVATEIPLQLRLQSRGASLEQVVRSGQRLEIRESMTGTRYTVENSRVVGTDGSNFRVVGSAIYSNSGLAYKIVGDTVRGVDGSICRRTLNTIRC
ncbi:MAG TPA: hypothetical protein PK306_25035 [Aquabacterium sp.]|nr:hypothetical protein [Aquabacterium sp.]